MKNLKIKGKTYNFRSIHLLIEDNPKDFFEFCLTHELYKKQDNFISRMKNVYNNEKPWQGISAVIVYDQNKPVGICLLEHRLLNNKKFITQAGLLKMNSRAKNPWQTKLQWHFIHAGFMSFYVKPEYRKIGLAHNTLKQMENLQYHTFLKEELPVEINEKKSDNCIIVTCRGIAQDIVKKSTLFHSVDCDTYHNNYNSDISHHSYKILFDHEPKKSIGEFKPKAITIENQFKTLSQKKRF